MIEIGTVAGKIWEELNKVDTMTVNAMMKTTGEKKDVVLMAIGWLAREEKLTATKKGASVIYSLK